MAAAGLRRGAHRIDPQPRGDVFESGNERRAVNVHHSDAILSYVPQQIAAARGRRRRRRDGVAGARARRLRRPACATASRAIVGAGRNHRGAAVVGIVVQRRQAAEHARRARTRSRGPRPTDASRPATAISSSASIEYGQPAGELERRQQRRRAAHVIADAAARADAVAIDAPGPRRAGSCRRPRARAHRSRPAPDRRGSSDRRRAQARLDRRRSLRRSASAPATSRCSAATSGADAGSEPLVVGDRGRFDQQRSATRRGR